MALSSCTDRLIHLEDRKHTPLPITDIRKPESESNLVVGDVKLGPFKADTKINLFQHLLERADAASAPTASFLQVFTQGPSDEMTLIYVDVTTGTNKEEFRNLPLTSIGRSFPIFDAVPLLRKEEEQGGKKKKKKQGLKFTPAKNTGLEDEHLDLTGVQKLYFFNYPATCMASHRQDRAPLQSGEYLNLINVLPGDVTRRSPAKATSFEMKTVDMDTPWMTVTIGSEVTPHRGIINVIHRPDEPERTSENQSSANEALPAMDASTSGLSESTKRLGSLLILAILAFTFLNSF